MTPDDLQRFMLNVVEFPDGCWIWIGSRTKRRSGYGRFDRQVAHRVSYEHHTGPVPDGQCVLHNCPGGDDSMCVNPAHLWLGTQLENIQDREAKRRGGGPKRRGLGNGRARLNEAQVREIRAAARRGVQQRTLAAQYGVGETTIGHIRYGRSWTHVGD